MKLMSAGGPLQRCLSKIHLLLLVVFAPEARAANEPVGPDQSTISIEGTVASARDDHFFLDYGDGVVRVEMDDWDWYEEGASMIEGDKVTVYGRIDDDVYETRTIEAGSVYVEGLSTFFYANPRDEEDWDTYLAHIGAEKPNFQVTGTVTSVSDRRFTIDTGARKVSVDTSQMPYNPLDNLGFQKIKKGDRVRVSGDLNGDLFAKREVEAESIVTLVRDLRRSGDS